MNLIKKITHGIAWRVRMVSRKTVGAAYKFITLKILYPSVYRRWTKKLPLNEKKAVFLEIRMLELTDSFRLLYGELERRGGYELQVACVGAGLTSRKQQRRNSVAALKAFADAKYVFISDSSSLISCITPRAGTEIIQTWHACGAFKKFGYSTAEKKFGGTYKELTRYPLHKNFSIVTVSSPEVVWAYAEAFHMEDRRQDILPIGISRTDIFYDKKAVGAAYRKVHTLMPASRDKKIILYAPTFRGRVSAAYSPDEMNLDEMCAALAEEYVLICKHHPFVKERPRIPRGQKNFAADLTDQMEIEELLMVSDICISDYSSLVFEYSLFERPMIFFAYDLEDYFDWRGFYYDYEEMTPGPVCRTTGEMIDYIQNIGERFDRQRVAEFREKFMSACDGHATERILDRVLET